MLATVLMAAIAPASADCTLLVSAETGKTLMEEGDCHHAMPPNSSFKIPIALMGYDAGILRDEQTPAMPFKSSYSAMIESWAQTTTPAMWMKNSVVWYSQEITGKLGMAAFRRYVQAFDYGNQDVSGNPGKHDGLTRSWLTSSLKITPYQQAAFIRKLVLRQLPVTAHAMEMTAKITRIQPDIAGWEIHGKTGSGIPDGPDGKEDWSRGFGWFVGWAENSNRKVIYVQLIQDKQQQDSFAGPRAREAMLQRLPVLLSTLPAKP